MPELRHLIFERKLSRVLSEPPNVRVAAGVIVSTTAVVVAGGGS